MYFFHFPKFLGLNKWFSEMVEVHSKTLLIMVVDGASNVMRLVILATFNPVCCLTAVKNQLIGPRTFF